MSTMHATISKAVKIADKLFVNGRAVAVYNLGKQGPGRSLDRTRQ